MYELVFFRNGLCTKWLSYPPDPARGSRQSVTHVVPVQISSRVPFQQISYGLTLNVLLNNKIALPHVQLELVKKKLPFLSDNVYIYSGAILSCTCTSVSIPTALAYMFRAKSLLITSLDKKHAAMSQSPPVVWWKGASTPSFSHENSWNLLLDSRTTPPPQPATLREKDRRGSRNLR